MDIHSASKNNWQNNAIEKILLEGIKEQRSSRRWRIFFRIVFFIYFTIIIALFFIDQNDERQPRFDAFGNKVTSPQKDHIALIHLNGVISASENASAEKLTRSLRQAAANRHVKGILIEANSPGGSPAQSSIVYKTIIDIKKTYKKPVMTVVTDVCASGCYYIASASDAIYADESSIVGSIGVISQIYGYQELAQKLGISPRTYTAGKNKDFMNPAREPRPDEVSYLKKLLATLHQHFIGAVKKGRGNKLADSPELFSGLFWSGDIAKQLGLIDDIATPEMAAKKIGDYPVYNAVKKSLLQKILKSFGTQTQQTLKRSAQQILSPKQSIEFK